MLVSSLDREPLWCRFPLLEWDPALLEWDSCLYLSCITCKALSLFASRSRSNGSVFWGLATSTWISVGTGIRMSSHHHVLSIAIQGHPSMPPHAQRRGQSPTAQILSFALAMRAHGSNWGFTGRGAQKTRSLSGNMSPNWLSSSSEPSSLAHDSPWRHGVAPADPWSGCACHQLSSVSVLTAVDVGVAPCQLVIDRSVHTIGLFKIWQTHLTWTRLPHRSTLLHGLSC